jgi:hypothetical protein
MFLPHEDDGLVPIGTMLSEFCIYQRYNCYSIEIVVWVAAATQFKAPA